MKPFILLFALLPILCFAQKSTTSNDKRITALDSAFERVLKTWKAPGFAVAVVQKNRIIYAKGFGYRDMEKKLPVTPNTLFAIGSCTKAFTTSLIGLLQQDGKLDIDKPAHQYLNELNFYSEDLTNKVTLRDMMSHRTGLPRHDYSWYLFGTSNRDSLFRRIQYQEPTYPLRSAWQYNNFMFVAQGAIAEKITGKTWEDNVREKILKPLGMTATNFSVHEMEKYSDAAIGYGLKKDSIIFRLPYYDINSAGPAGSINSSVTEMANWVITWINGGKFRDSTVLSPTFVRDAMSSQAVISGGMPSSEKPDIYFSNYGFGWFLSSYKGHYRVEHGGNIDGFSASTSFFPTDSIGIIVLTNQDGSSVPSIVRNLIVDKLLGKPYFNWNDDLKRAADKAKQSNLDAEKVKLDAQVKGTKPSHNLNEYEGIYTNAGYGSFDVFTRRDSLFARTPGKTIWLKHYHYDIFVPYLTDDSRYDPSEPSNNRIQFVTGINGEIESLNSYGFESSTINLNFKRSAKEKAISKNEAETYAGTYTIAGMDIKYYTKGSTLYMFVEGQPEYELVPVGSDKFTVKNLNGFAVQFLRTGNTVDAVNLIQPNGTFKAEKKKS